MTTTRSALTGLFIAFCLLAAPSHALAADGKLSGNVTLNGKLLVEGKITFHMANGQFVGSTIKDGKYLIDRVPVGSFKVTVEGEGVPVAFASAKTTSLAVEVTEGPTNLDFNIK
ncbi:MAG TPA: carboxypeptidase-like regulatory domain-containing protein [Gemmata sp.]|jgi:hypothetical protein|nr:carboxypeptidase-like regulatory domain-containing protein [Gemmata sp.]